jgi:hypothetical protein
MATTAPESDSLAAQSPQFRHLPAVLLVLLALTVVLRCGALCRPLLGQMATKNVIYGMIARNLANGDGTLLCPTLDMLRGGEKGLHLVEFPLAAYITGGMWRLLGGSLDVWGRSRSVAISFG